jgi:hypothetical protein
MSEETNDKKTRLRSASRSTLPRSSEIPDSETFKNVNKLLKEAVGLKVKVSEAEERLDEIKNELASIAMAYDMAGFRHALAGFEYHGYTSRQALNKQALIEKVSAYGCPASVIEESYKAGETFLDTKFVVFDLE